MQAAVEPGRNKNRRRPKGKDSEEESTNGSNRTEMKAKKNLNSLNISMLF